MRLPATARVAALVGRRVAVTLAGLVCVLGLGSLLAVSLANHAGYQALGMKTGSMSPTINPGDLVIAHAIRPTDIRNGDIITFREPLGSHAPYTHRVVRTIAGQDGPQFITKGDANPTTDVWTVHYAAEGWRVGHVFRHGGLLLAVEQSVAGRRILAVSVFILTVALLWPVFAGQPRTGAGEPAGAAETGPAATDTSAETDSTDDSDGAPPTDGAAPQDGAATPQPEQVTV